MKALARLLAGAAVLAALILQVQPAFAQATRTWVSGVGDDVNPCSRTAPCKTFAGAISKTAAGGIINCLDSAGFGALTITKSITIECTGVVGGVLASGTNGIVVNAAPTDVVTLRGLDIEGAGTTPGYIGVYYLGGAVLHVENCKIYGFKSGTAEGIRAIPSGGGALIVADTSLTDNGTGVIVFATGTGTKATLRRVDATANGIGIEANGSSGGAYAVVQATDVVAAGNTNVGVISRSGPTSVFMDRVSAVNNANAGVLVNGATSQVVIGNSTISGNGAGVVLQNSGHAYSYLTNQINANTGPDGTPLPNSLPHN